MYDLENGHSWMPIVYEFRMHQELYKFLKPKKHKSPLYMLRLAQTAITNSKYEEARELLLEVKDYFPESELRQIEILHLAVTKYYTLAVTLTEISEELPDSFYEDPINISNPYWDEVRFLLYYVYGMYSSTNMDFEKAKRYFEKLLSIPDVKSLDNFEIITEYVSDIDFFLSETDLNEHEAYLSKRVYSLSGYVTKAGLEARASLARLRGRRGDYSGSYELIRHFPDFLLPPWTKVLGSIVSRKPIKYDVIKVRSSPDLAWLEVIAGVMETDAERVMKAGEIARGNVPPRVYDTCSLGYAWALTCYGRFDEAHSKLREQLTTFLEYDIIVTKSFVALNLCIKSLLKIENGRSLFLESLEKILRYFPLLAFGKDAHEGVGRFPDCIWLLSCLSEEFFSYYIVRDKILVFQDSVYMKNKTYTTPIYRSIFLNDVTEINKEAIKKAKQRIDYHSIMLNNPLIINVELLEAFVSSLPNEIPQSIQLKLAERMRELKEKFI
jgi:tetratricopeptide (TPR) repeat protein